MHYCMIYIHFPCGDVLFWNNWLRHRKIKSRFEKNTLSVYWFVHSRKYNRKCEQMTLKNLTSWLIHNGDFIYKMTEHDWVKWTRGKLCTHNIRRGTAKHNENDSKRRGNFIVAVLRRLNLTYKWLLYTHCTFSFARKFPASRKNPIPAGISCSVMKYVLAVYARRFVGSCVHTPWRRG